MFKVKIIKLEVKISGEIDTPDRWRAQEFCSWGGSTNSVEDRERGSGGGSPLPPSQGFWRQL